jgi:hypothetical protein
VCYCKAESDAKNIETYGDLLCKMLRSGGVHRGVLGAQEHFEVVVEERVREHMQNGLNQAASESDAVNGRQ